MTEAGAVNSEPSGSASGQGNLNEMYLPFTEEELQGHFVDTAADHLGYYRNHLAKQMEYDERFWVVTTLKKLFDAHVDANGQYRNALTQVLDCCLNSPPDGYSNWRDALGKEPRLLFEVAMPAPNAYRAFLKSHYHEVTLNLKSLEGKRAPRTRFEGQTWVDAVLVGDTGVAVLFEAKVLSDVSCRIHYDVTRNQIARNIDVMLEPGQEQSSVPLLQTRNPELSHFVLLTPEIFKNDYPESRLYGWLMEKYKDDPKLLAGHLSHREEAGTVEHASRRMGWLTFEKCNKKLPGACPWMKTSE